MKVICIEVPVPDPKIEHTPKIKYGEVYTVVDHGGPSTTFNGFTIKKWYELAEDIGVCYQQDMFIPLSYIDETEMIREYNTEKV